VRRPGEGATFRIDLPLACAAVDEDVDTVAAQEAGS
jgi:hypothetical protein